MSPLTRKMRKWQLLRDITEVCLTSFVLFLYDSVLYNKRAQTPWAHTPLVGRPHCGLHTVGVGVGGLVWWGCGGGREGCVCGAVRGGGAVALAVNTLGAICSKALQWSLTAQSMMCQADKYSQKYVRIQDFFSGENILCQGVG